MKYRTIPILLASLALSATAWAGAPEEKSNVPQTPLAEGWQFTLAVPAILPSFKGEVGIHGLSSQIDVPADKVIRNLEMAAFFRGEKRSRTAIPSCPRGP